MFPLDNRKETLPTGKARSSFDVIIVGLGTMGAATAWQLARKGFRVLGLEQYGVAHAAGSHTGQSRLVRKAYFEHPDYVPLLEMAYQGWSALEAETGTKLYHETGLLYMAPGGDPVTRNVFSAAGSYGIPVEMLTSVQCRRLFPAFVLPDHFEAVWEPQAGFVLAEQTVRTLHAAAVAQGAILHTEEQAVDWELSGDKVVVCTPAGRYAADRLVLTGGAWSGALTPFLENRLVVTRQALAWFQPLRPELFTLGNFPCWCLADDRFPGICYGFPALPETVSSFPTGCKVAHHAPGPVMLPNGERVPMLPEEKQVLTDCILRFIPTMGTEWTHTSSCLYTYSPDEDFLVDLLPGTGGQVVVAAGFSGHGFKFAPAVGTILADLATEGRTEAPIGFLGLDRLV
ncbi:MAG: hypothetical protein RLY31_3015 [Bacteroidota bacterium]